QALERLDGGDAGVVVVEDLDVAGVGVVDVIEQSVAGDADDAALGDGVLGAAEGGAGLGALAGLGAVRRTSVAAVVSAGADDDAQVVAVDDAVAVDVAVEPAVRGGACAVVAQADDDADVVAIDVAVEVKVAVVTGADENAVRGQDRAAQVVVEVEAQGVLDAAVDVADADLAEVLVAGAGGG